MEFVWWCHWFQRPPKAELVIPGRKPRKVKDDVLFKPRSLPVLLVDRGTVFIVGGTVGITDVGKWDAFAAPISSGGSPGSGMRWEPVAIGGRNAPQPRTCFSVTPSPMTSSSVILFGGCNDKQCNSETWELKAEGGALTWAQQTYKANTHAPPKRYSCASAYDTRSHIFYVHGGCVNPAANGPEDVLGDMWAFDVTTRTWTEITPSMLEGEDRPCPRSHHTLVISHGSVYVAGGWGGSHSLEDVWSVPCGYAPTAAHRCHPWRRVVSWQGPRPPIGTSHVAIPGGLHVWVHGQGVVAMDFGGDHHAPRALTMPASCTFLPRDAAGMFWHAATTTLYVSCGVIGFTKLADMWLCKILPAGAV